MKRIIGLIVSVFISINVNSRTIGLKTLIQLCGANKDKIILNNLDWELNNVKEDDIAFSLEKGEETIGIKTSSYETIYITKDIQAYNKILSDAKKAGFVSRGSIYANYSDNIKKEYIKDAIYISFLKCDKGYSIYIADYANKKRMEDIFNKLVDENNRLCKLGINEYYNNNYSKAIIYFDSASLFHDNSYEVQYLLNNSKNRLIEIKDYQTNLRDLKMDNYINKQINNIINDELFNNENNFTFKIVFQIDTLGKIILKTDNIYLSDICIEKIMDIDFDIKEIYGHKYSYTNTIEFQNTTTTTKYKISHYTHKGIIYDKFSSIGGYTFEDSVFIKSKAIFNNGDGMYHFDVKKRHLVSDYIKYESNILKITSVNYYSDADFINYIKKQNKVKKTKDNNINDNKATRKIFFISLISGMTFLILISASAN